jgi:hypothetical protein
MPCQVQYSSQRASKTWRLAVLGPLVLTADLVFLLGGEVVLDVESLTDLLRGLSLDHVGDGLAADVEESLDVHVVGGEDDLEEHLLIDLHELLVPLFNVGGLLAGVGIVILGGRRVVLVLRAPLKDLLENVLGNLGECVSGLHVFAGAL